MTDVEQCSLHWVKLPHETLYCVPNSMADAAFRQAIYAYSDYGYYGEIPQGLPTDVELLVRTLAHDSGLEKDRNTRRGQQKRMKDNSSKGKQKTEDGYAVPPADGDAVYNAEEVKRHAERCGLPVSDTTLETARHLADEYGLDQLLKAMTEAAQKKPTWPYVRGILENWKNGSVPWSKHNSNPKNNYEQHDDGETDAAEKAQLADLLREARNGDLDGNQP